MKTLIQRLDQKKLEKSVEMLKSIAHPMRIAMIDLLQNYGRLTVTEIYQELELEQAVASHHLGILKSKGVLSSERKGKNTYYYIRYDRVSQIIDCIEKVSNNDDFF